MAHGKFIPGIARTPNHPFYSGGGHIRLRRIDRSMRNFREGLIFDPDAGVVRREESGAVRMQEDGTIRREE